MPAHDGDILFQKTWWLGRRLEWTGHAVMRSGERCVPIFTHLPRHAKLYHIQDTPEGVIALWQIWHNDAPYVIVGKAAMDTHRQEPVITVKTCYVEDLMAKIVERRIEHRRQQRTAQRAQRRTHREVDRATHSRIERLRYARKEITGQRKADRYEEDM
jgi:hypothetical protein